MPSGGRHLHLAFYYTPTGSLYSVGVVIVMPSGGHHLLADITFIWVHLTLQVCTHMCNVMPTGRHLSTGILFHTYGFIVPIGV